MRSIPEEIQIDILSRLPIISLFRFRCVCKAWLQLLTKDPHFRKLHDSRRNNKEASIILTEVGIGRTSKIYSDRLPTEIELKSPVKRSHEIIGSSNGLLCLKHCINDDALFLWNPATRDHCPLPTPPSPSAYSERTYFGFGFHQGTSTYKVVRIHCSPYPGIHSSVWIYTIGGQDTWRALAELSCSIRLGGKGEKISTLVNGTLYWIQTNWEIGSLDLGDEVFQIIPKPNYDIRPYSTHIGELGGFLCFYCVFANNEVDIWMMKDNGVAKSWIESVKLQSPGNDYWSQITPVGFWRSGKVIVCGRGPRLCMYNLEGEFIREIDSLMDGNWQACSYIESLISPRDILKKEKGVVYEHLSIPRKRKRKY